MIKQGKRVKAGSKWLPTHRALPVCPDPLPGAYRVRLGEVLRCLAAAEKAKPSPPGQSFSIQIKGRAATGLSYKWLGKDDAEKRVGIAGVMIDSQHHLSVEMGAVPVAYFHEGEKVYRLEVPGDLHASFSEILSRTPNKFIGQERAQPSTGVLDLEAFQQHTCIAGLDESGRGTIVSSLVAACVLITPDSPLPPVYDSKVIGRPDRERLFGEIEQSGVAFAFATVDAEAIDRIGITEANAMAFDLAIDACERKAGRPAGLLLIDGGKLPVKAPRPKRFVTKGESVSRAIAAASIIATTVHERLMRELHQKYPQWGFDKNMGYARPDHLEALQRFGICPEHRKSFSPVKQIVAAQLETERRAGQLTMGLQ